MASFSSTSGLASTWTLRYDTTSPPQHTATLAWHTQTPLPLQILAVIAELRKEMQKLLASLVKGDQESKAKHTNVVAAVMKILKEERVGNKDTPTGI